MAGGELTGPDRRKVERHLITCPDCRDHARSLSGALAALRAAAAQAPEGVAEAPSLWPALQLQIREAKHAPRPLSPTFPWSDLLATLAPLRPQLRTAAVLALGLTVGGLASAGVNAWVRRQVDAARAEVAAAARPLPPLPVAPPALPGPVDPGFDPGTLARSETPISPSRAPSRYDYDLDRGTPMGDGGDIKASY
jgi:anti-sigma factor RsiW